MSKLKNKPRKRKGGLFRRIRGRTTHRLPAYVSKEDDDWTAETPSIKLSRAFVVVLVLHVVAVGGILAFELLKPESTGPAVSDSSSLEERVKIKSPKLSDRLPPGKKIGDPEVQDLEYHRVQSAESLTSIAITYGVTARELEKLNNLDQGEQIYPGKLLFIPGKTIAAATSEDVRNVMSNGSAGASRPEPTVVQQSPPTPTPSPQPAPAPAPAPTPTPMPEPEATITVAAVEPAPLPAPEPVVAKVEPTPAPTPEPAPAPKKKIESPTVAKREPAPAPKKTTPPKIEKRVVAKKKAPAPTVVKTSYRVSRGDTVYAIARRHGIPPRDLMKANGLSTKQAGNLRIGQTIRIPKR